jgi:RNA polymerase sigma-70 factor, ECF subfamily
VDPPEDSLVSALRCGTVQAFDAVYARYRVTLFTFLCRLCGHPPLAEDLFQNTWLKLARSAPRLRPDTDLKAWLFSVARNEYRSHRRWQRVDIRRLLAAKTELAGQPSPASPSAALRDANWALAQMSVSDRELLLLVSIDGIEPRGAADILGISYAAVRQRLARARAQLSRLLAELEP